MPGKSGHFEPFNLIFLIPAALCLWFFRQIEFIWLEFILLLAALALASFRTPGSKWRAHAPLLLRPLRQTAGSPFLLFLMPAALSVLLRTALLPWIPVPNPVVPDEFSHILLARTFLLGRLTNPAHPLWQHFESIHILSQPTYSSMYMAGQACFLALGKLLFGNLFWGVVLSTALFCGTLAWFLRAYVPPYWALFGGLLAAVRIGAASYWNDSYWGGSAGALAGAMILGAYPRLIRTWKPAYAAIFASGLVLLASTRPWEGAVLGAVMVTAVIVHLLKTKSDAISWAQISRCAAIAILILGLSGWAMTRQWKAVTGHAFTLPYQVNQQTYGWPLTLPWIKVTSVTYRHSEFALYHDFEINEHRQITELSQIPIGLLLKYGLIWRFFLGVSLSPVLLCTTRILKSRRTRVIWIASGIVALAVFSEQSGYPHYWSPIAPAILLFVVEGLRYLSRRRLGAAIVSAVIPILCMLLIARVATPRPSSSNFLSWCCTNVAPKDREPLVRQLESMPGDHLVIVSYNVKTYDTFEWVYNEPDIDHAKIVFARDMGPEENEKLIRYYPERHVWRVRVEKDRVAALESLSADRKSPN
jgi:hypothetical protein